MNFEQLISVWKGQHQFVDNMIMSSLNQVRLNQAKRSGWCKINNRSCLLISNFTGILNAYTANPQLKYNFAKDAHVDYQGELVAFKVGLILLTTVQCRDQRSRGLKFQLINFILYPLKNTPPPKKKKTKKNKFFRILHGTYKGLLAAKWFFTCLLSQVFWIQVSVLEIYLGKQTRFPIARQ